jgi:hypothetical protein
MELNTYCDNLSTELDHWKHRFDEVVEKIDMEEGGNGSGIVWYLKDLHNTRKELENRIKLLKTECPASWDTERIQSPFARLESESEEVWYKGAPSDIGG